MNAGLYGDRLLVLALHDLARVATADSLAFSQCR